MMSMYEVVIGLEVHTQLMTQSNFFVHAVPNSERRQTLILARFARECRGTCPCSIKSGRICNSHGAGDKLPGLAYQRVCSQKLLLSGSAKSVSDFSI